MGNIAGKKILFIITKSNWGGAQAYVYTLAKRFKEAGADVSVALGGTGGKGDKAGLLATRLRETGVRTIFVSTFERDISFFRELVSLSELTKILKSEMPDTLYLSSSKAGGLGALAGRLAQVPTIIFTSHGLAYDEDRGIFARALILLSTWATFLLSDHVIVLSKDSLMRARRLPLCARKINLIYNGIDTVALKGRTEARSGLLHADAADSPPNELWIGTIAELTRNKGLEYLLEAAALLKQQGSTFRLCIIGTGELESELRAQAQRLGISSSIVFAGYVEHASTHLPAFDIFALTSLKEGLPYALLEAGNAGIASVASRIAGVTDIIEDRRSGLLVPAKNPEAIAEALQELLQDPTLREELGTGLKVRVTQFFSTDRMVEETAVLS